MKTNFRSYLNINNKLFRFNCFDLIIFQNSLMKNKLSNKIKILHPHHNNLYNSLFHFLPHFIQFSLLNNHHLHQQSQISFSNLHLYSINVKRRLNNWELPNQQIIIHHKLLILNKDIFQFSFLCLSLYLN